MKGIDCATPIKESTAQSLAAAGMEFVCRYLVLEKYAWKRLTRSEAKIITAADMQIISVFETSACRAAGGAVTGKADGAAAYKEAQLIRQPTGTAIYFAVDFDAQPPDYNAIADYLKAAEEQIPGYAVGVYGSYAVIEEIVRRGIAKHFWQTYAWSYGQKSQKANIYQYKNDISIFGIGVDLNESFGNEGFWNTEVKRMLMSPEDANKIIAFLQAAWSATEDPAARSEFHRLANELRKVSGLKST